MVVKTKAKDLIAMLAEDIPYFVCPVTGTKIPSTDTEAIKIHKERVLADLTKREKQEAAKDKQKTLLKVCKTRIQEATKLSQVKDILQTWLGANGVSTAKYSKLAVVPVQSSAKIVAPFVVVTGVPKCDTLLSKVLGPNCRHTYGFYPEASLTGYFVLLPARSFLAKALLEYYSKCTTRWGGKLSETDRALLQGKNKAYGDGVARQKTIAKQLHDLREEHRKIEKELADIRTLELNAGREFEYL